MSIKILYAEDELSLGKIVKESLESRGYQVLMETDGAMVLNRFVAFNPDVCVLDIMMPNKNGFEVAEQIRLVSEATPIIFLTAKTQTDDVVKGFNVGGNDYIRKPFSMEELIVRIQNVLRKKETETLPEEGDVLRIGSYVFQPNRLLLTKGSTERKLTYREAELLRLFYFGRNNIIDRRDVLSAIWGNDSFFNSRNLDVYITKLRAYLKEDSRLEIITIKGVGYRFVADA